MTYDYVDGFKNEEGIGVGREELRGRCWLVLGMGSREVNEEGGG